MTENHALIEALILKHARGKKLNKREQKLWDEWTNQSDQHRQLSALFKDPQWLRENLRRIEKISTDDIWQNVQKQIREGQDPPIVVPMRPWWRRPVGIAAAVLIVLLVTSAVRGLYLWVNGKGNVNGEGQASESVIVARPGHFQVLLTLGDGNTEVLDSVTVGEAIVVEGHSMVTKQDAHTLVYTPGPVKAAHPIYHSLATGRTEPFTVQLADGSRVHLSYASRLRYPTTFSGPAREVFLEGEAYFDIAKDASRPFVVQTAQSGIRVLGTEFNVMAYGNEPRSEVSLFDGSLEVLRGRDTVRLKPRQQAVVSDEGLSIRNITNPAQVLAWRDSCWRFDNTDLLTAVRQIARWHQMAVANPKGIKGIVVSGQYHHRESLDAILQNMQLVESGNARLQKRRDTIYINSGSSR
ncbi:FecR family protein [Puia dinghuensis]|uniref:Iron dicitrate transporter FecR n=1 Tax=Puia dinghuensis TaxID=1792502 RepID=A0A8J2XWG4_9BACT|nr:FecR domain-containing protein [Puia dinghuensis]GGB23606.1 iron dicitrate transporter FecR [Puia dinghuensis]